MLEQRAAGDEQRAASFELGGRTWTSRLIVGTGSFRSLEQMEAALRAAGTEIVTVALRRVDPGARGSLLEVIERLGLFALPYLWVLVLALLYTRWAARPLVSAVVTGVGASGAGLFIATAVKLGRPIARKPAAVVLMAGCFIAVAIGRVPLLVVMPIAVIVGLYLSRRHML